MFYYNPYDPAAGCAGCGCLLFFLIIFVLILGIFAAL